MKKMNKKIPKFKNEDEEREFWATQSPLDYFDAGNFKRASFPKLKPSLKSISIRLPNSRKQERCSLSELSKDLSGKTNCFGKKFFKYLIEK
jgi:hypothetical protein